MPVSHSMTMDMLMTPMRELLLSPALLAGLAVSAVFLFDAVRLRRAKGAI